MSFPALKPLGTAPISCSIFPIMRLGIMRSLCYLTRQNYSPEVRVVDCSRLLWDQHEDRLAKVLLYMSVVKNEVADLY